MSDFSEPEAGNNQQPESTFPGRSQAMPHAPMHFVNGKSVDRRPDSCQQAMFGLGCFWGAERKFWQLEGVFSTSVGYSAGQTRNPTYQEVCSGLTGHNEVVRVWYDPKVISYQALLETFWTSHDPTQGMRQGNDIGSQYRSGIYTYCAIQQQQAEASRQHYQQRLTEAGAATITTEIQSAEAFYFAEDYHQQYLAKSLVAIVDWED